VFKANKILMAVAASLIVSTPGVVFAQAVEKPAGKTVITSDSLMFDYGRSTCLFEGNVVATEPRLKLECSKLYVFFDATNNVDSIVATDSVRVMQDNRLGTCDKAVYSATTGAIVMSGNATLTRGRDTIHGDEIKIFVNSEKVTCTPGRLVVFPESFEKTEKKRER
jgi:lipopolysaccharide export system protein LptA